MMPEQTQRKAVKIMNKHECDCTIGTSYPVYGGMELVTLDDLKEERSRIFSGVENIDDIDRFNFCPYCGKKIDWKNIKIV